VVTMGVPVAQMAATMAGWDGTLSKALQMASQRTATTMARAGLAVAAEAVAVAAHTFLVLVAVFQVGVLARAIMLLGAEAHTMMAQIKATLQMQTVAMVQSF
jgi:hypothetical protein